jgi:hypothetical protein
MVKAILGIVLSIGIVVGSVMVVDGLDPLDGAAFDRLRGCIDANRDLQPTVQVNCWGRFGEQKAASDSKEKLLGGVLGLGLAGLGWLLAWLFYIKPRRRAAAAGGQSGPA